MDLMFYSDFVTDQIDARTLSHLAFWFVLAGLIRYAWTVKRDKTDSTLASWIIWFALDMVTLGGMFKADTVNGQIIGTVIGEVFVVHAAYHHAKRAWALVDKVCLGLGCIGLTIVCCGDPATGIAATLIGVFIGAIPTFVSALKDPTREDKLAWILFWISCVYELRATPWPWTIAAAAQPITFTVIETIMLYLLFLHPRLRKAMMRTTAST